MLNLRHVLELKGIPQKACAGFLDMAEKTFYNKSSGITDFTYPEVKKLKSLLPEYDIDYLLSDAAADLDDRPM